MIVVNTDYISGYEIWQVLGIAQGSVVQSKHVGRDIMAGLKTIVGGEIKGYTEMLTEARKIAFERMVQDAETLNADGIVNVRYTTSEVMQGSSELLAYGTAVKIKKR
ncbi:hypothetical protein CR194_03945 [Salipaludibacillus keqinensis]|uniref:UPF0145 protein CR194_03945 n=2 Tax=Salipaludibacillus keqinensis TaxID=2045207 RepID=A0A323TRZ2_9BACI|nr:YbjQ family protein [Salipaludibacillus keqinensis]PYZ95333.1 hypothetical protein CR194_03945 [Salipaludibacillus keqinensis]